MEEAPNFPLFSSQNSDLHNEQLDKIGQEAQAKTPREQLSSRSRDGARKEKLQWISKQ